MPVADEEKSALVELYGRMDERLKVVERFVYGFTTTIGVAFLTALAALVFRTPH